MQAMNPLIDAYLTDGCGRCSLYRTPQCKVHKWTPILEAMRHMLLSTELTEELKWSQPVYTFQGQNVIIMASFKEFCSLSYINGALLSDPAKILTLAGENSHIDRIVKFTTEQEFAKVETNLLAYIQESIENVKAGKKVEKKAITEYELPEELEAMFKEHAGLETAFRALTPGRQRGYLLHFSQPKQAATRFSRIEKCMEAIFKGKGMQD